MIEGKRVGRFTIQRTAPVCSERANAPANGQKATEQVRYSDSNAPVKNCRVLVLAQSLSNGAARQNGVGDDLLGRVVNFPFRLRMRWLAAPPLPAREYRAPHVRGSEYCGNRH